LWVVGRARQKTRTKHRGEGRKEGREGGREGGRGRKRHLFEEARDLTEDVFGHVSEGFDFLHARVLRQHGKDLREGGRAGEREERRTEMMKQLNKREGGREGEREGTAPFRLSPSRPP